MEAPIVSIIGSGFCGTALAIHLLRNAKAPLHIQLINRTGSLARGLAYGTRSESHLLNVPAGRMSLFDEHPEDFLTFVRSGLPDASGGDFVSRSLYGDYLEARLAQAIARRHPSVSFEALKEQVVDLIQRNAHAELELSNGHRIKASKAVVATGNFLPAVPVALTAVADNPRFIRDPWKVGVLDAIQPDDSVLMIGTGLTMFDVALSLQDQGHRGMTEALSRRALLPQPHRANLDPPSLPEPPSSISTHSSIRALLTDIRKFIKSSQHDGFDWRDALAALRPVTPTLWHNLEEAERLRFLRHLRPYWDVHRHRAAPAIAQRVKELVQAQRLRIRAGHIANAQALNAGLEVTIRARSNTSLLSMKYDYIINCTGPCSDVTKLEEPLFQNLLARAAIKRDAIGLGLESTTEYRLISEANEPQESLFLLSPMLKASHWEAIAVPELRVHASKLASILLHS